jgi:hypothetical protein
MGANKERREMTGKDTEGTPMNIYKYAQNMWKKAKNLSKEKVFFSPHKGIRHKEEPN